MTTGCCYLEGSFDVFLTLHVAKVEPCLVVTFVKFGSGIKYGGGKFGLSIEEVNHLAQVFHTIYIEFVYNSSLAHVILRNDNAFEAHFASLYSHRQRTLNGKYAAVEREFAHKHILGQLLGRYLLIGSQQSYGQWQVVCSTFFANVGRRHIDNDLSARKLVIVVCESRLYAFVALLDCGVGQSYHKKTYALRAVYFDSHYQGVDALHRSPKNFYKHWCCLFLWFEFRVFD